MNYEEQHAKLLRWRENERGRRMLLRAVRGKESYQSGSMHVNESIDRRVDRCCIYNTREG